MSTIKARILQIIYTEFEQWASSQDFCCRVGCSTCCTLNVTITALEGKRILEFCVDTNIESWLLDKLNQIKNHPAELQQTTNEFVRATLSQRESPDPAPFLSGTCPFLENARCRIYKVRPLSCRCFASEAICNSKQWAIIPDHYLYGSTATLQIIEHLDQFNRWGFMADVLINLLLSNNYTTFDIDKLSVNGNLSSRLRQAQPLPGFIIPPEHEMKITPLLHSIFTNRIGKKTVGQILNNQ